MIVVVEVLGRLVFGLANPPLLIEDAEIEYLYAPNQDLLRFGNRVVINRFAMRSRELDLAEGGNKEIRVLVFGDSVVNGGALTDQSELATSILETRWRGDARLFVGNISAGSWGPGNQLAYVHRFGFFDSTVAIFVFSSHDYWDVPTFAPLDPSTHPTTAPLSAVGELFFRYAPRYVPRFGKGRSELSHPQASGAKQRQNSAEQIESLLNEATSSCDSVFCVMWPEQKEALQDEMKSGYQEIMGIAMAADVPVVEVSQWMDRHSEDEIRAFYRDAIHPSVEGQLLIADVLVSCLSSSELRSGFVIPE